MPSPSLKFVPLYSPIAPKNRWAQSFTQKKKNFNVDMKRDMTYPMIPRIFLGSTFIILKWSVFVKWWLILLKNLSFSKWHQLLRVSYTKVVYQNFFNLQKPLLSVFYWQRFPVIVLTCMENLQLIEKKEKIELKESKQKKLRCFIPMQPSPLVKPASIESSQDWLSLSKWYLWEADVPWLIRMSKIGTLRDTWQKLGERHSRPTWLIIL